MKQTKFKVICLGSATVDYFATVHEKLKSVSYGQKVLVKDLEVFTGGGGSNAAVGLARLGLKSSYLGKLGDDGAGETILSEFKQEGVEVIPVKPFSDAPTAISFILKSEQERDRIIYAYKGAADELRFTDFDKRRLTADWLYLGTLMGEAFKTAEKIVKTCRRKKIKILFNPSTYLAGKGKKFLQKILENTEILILNKEEAQLLCSRKEEISLLLPELKRLIIKNGAVVITNGPLAVAASDGKKIYWQKPPQVRVLHTAGAGDAFNAGFLAGYIYTGRIDKALKLGVINAGEVVQHYGAKNNLMHLDKARRYFK
ncbi:carbohydrate kinase family protein [Candidatus Woesearchaeota archaeon]|nr:carbohydrate kinase family protein [Candidatus Woesearchaeota archaeon]